ncbi:MAG: hypothetical protein MSC53_07745 [Arcanobacterium sp.]|nr:hypothetical protein [Arcanobacterium sp.]
MIAAPVSRFFIVPFGREAIFSATICAESGIDASIEEGSSCVGFSGTAELSEGVVASEEAIAASAFGDAAYWVGAAAGAECSVLSDRDGVEVGGSKTPIPALKLIDISAAIYSDILAMVTLLSVRGE